MCSSLALHFLQSASGKRQRGRMANDKRYRLEKRKLPCRSLSVSFSLMVIHVLPGAIIAKNDQWIQVVVEQVHGTIAGKIVIRERSTLMAGRVNGTEFSHFLPIFRHGNFIVAKCPVCHLIRLGPLKKWRDPHTS